MKVAATPRLNLGHIERFNGRKGEYIVPGDEALIFIDDDNEKTCHVQGERAHEYAALIVRAVNTLDANERLMETMASALDRCAGRLESARQELLILNARLGLSGDPQNEAADDADQEAVAAANAALSAYSTARNGG